ncbi:helix-turn-helix transcriptional regulator [Kineosporia sp. NBRC 101731]|uniref:helix-turn-helix domain-containing protein n=1 Tax=Kineosporia sp. NBRC 101731 TaxID=3032199 RepID=UPI0024A13954|nr:helix-turn-helix transcriptional regulator [Kineosporia sp. NBRC 101731]GLY29079.1 transcriptional regulator [Kineosporia sp. NBRC 101731]
MSNRDEVKAFLTSRRAKVTPEQVGLSMVNRGRRVPGLRRSEVADLAGVSVEYYAQLERGNLAGVSESVLDALSRALRLDEAERCHLLDLAAAAGPGRARRRKPIAAQVRPTVQRLLDLMPAVPAIINNAYLDTVAANDLGRALFAPVFDSSVRLHGGPVNHARFTFLDARAQDFWTDWERAADDAVASLRVEAGRNPYDKNLSGLVGELSTRSEAFRRRWAAHDVRLHQLGTKHFRHPAVGEMHLNFEVLELPADPGLLLVTFTAPAGSPDADALALLATWAATQNPSELPRQ